VLGRVGSAAPPAGGAGGHGAGGIGHPRRRAQAGGLLPIVRAKAGGAGVAAGAAPPAGGSLVYQIVIE